MLGPAGLPAPTPRRHGRGGGPCRRTLAPFTAPATTNKPGGPLWGLRAYWRMGWDSNPRGALTPAGFQDRSLKPLGHPSGCGGVDTILPWGNAEGLSCAASPVMAASSCMRPAPLQFSLTAFAHCRTTAGIAAVEGRGTPRLTIRAAQKGMTHHVSDRPYPRSGRCAGCGQGRSPVPAGY